MYLYIQMMPPSCSSYSKLEQVSLWSAIQYSYMVPELEKPRVTELQVRMDCNGCVQKIKKAMHSVDGVYDFYIDVAQQKLTVVGRAELEKIVKAIKKTRKIATVCSHTDPNAPPPPPADPPADAQTPPPAPDQPPADAPPAEPPKEAPPTPPQEKTTEEKAAEAASIEPKVVEEVHMVHHYPYRYLHQWTAPKSRYEWAECCDEEYYSCRRGGDATMFSEENPNACTIV